MTTTPKRAVRDVSQSRVFQMLARSGYAVNGLLHVLIGGIAIGIALRGGQGGEADQSGALQGLSDTPGGLVVLWISVVGLFALGLWEVAQVILATDPDAKKKWGKRAKEAGKAVVYLVLGSTALVFALGGSSDSSENSKSASATALATPGGVFLLVAVGLAVVGFGIGFISIGIRRTFRKLITTPAGAAGRAVTVLGVVGYIAQGVALAVVGVLFVVAAVTYDAEKAAGLDGALKSLTDLPFGIVVLVAVGVGLIFYGVFLGARARLARL
ncbi:DUF1206 domain-containing protein [Herbiconiux sp. CPCC 205763]|uniref:DUF1206 domain-containing protein n=1 Tax=Herbiconiux aconitum TaxID=2970913 RepID=A0ABT2GXR5_9MICO|nr:DUF1206 domain-containing protein [Herbiconiux aconitum]MCS5720362.1 DUF1206 domain-containing protein [Herbiconiux aconitum]